MNRLAILNSVVLWCWASHLAFGLEPANPKVIPKARSILNYLESLPQQAEKRLLSGQFTSYGPTASLAECQSIINQCGHWPAITGFDYADFSTGTLETKTVNQYAKEYSRAGGLVTISTHLYNPANPKKGGLYDKGVDIETLITPGHENHRLWMEELDLLAEGLHELRDADVPVLWRPFHEMNGDWFWWGKKNPEVFIRVWKHMFDYLTHTKHLNNLLWVYSPNHGSLTRDYYPGDQYVDLIGLDAYTDHIDPEHIRGYREITQISKPFGFTEYGPHGSVSPPGDYDYTKFIQGVQAHFPRATFFQAWHGNWSLSKNHNGKQLLEHPWVVNREDLPRELVPVDR